jgi:hypothetical protein
MAALVALKDAGFQIIDWMWRSANQMRIATALVTAKRHNELLRRNDSRIPVHKPRPTPVPEPSGSRQMVEITTAGRGDRIVEGLK